MSNVEELFDQMAGRFDSDAWGGSDAVLEFNITGEGGGTWTATIDGGELSVTEGEAEDPSMSLTCTADDFVKIANGELSGVNAFMMGKLKIDGDMSMAMKLQQLLS